MKQSTIKFNITRLTNILKRLEAKGESPEELQEVKEKLEEYLELSETK